MKGTAVLMGWVDRESGQVVDAGVYGWGETPSPNKSGLTPAVLANYRCDQDHATAKASLLAEVAGDPQFEWLRDMPTLRWQLDWATCSGVCYAAPTPPNPAVAPSGGPR